MTLEQQQLPTAQHHEYANFFASVEDLRRLNTFSQDELDIRANRVFAVCAVCVDVLRDTKPANPKGVVCVASLIFLTCLLFCSGRMCGAVV